MSKKTCAGCEHFEQFPGQRDGQCWGAPPVVFPSGGQGGPPKVRENRPACHFFDALPEGAKPAVKIKSDPETPGDAAKAARRNK